MKNLLLFSIFIVLSFLGCRDKFKLPQSVEQLFFNGKIYTVNPNQVWADAIYVKDGIIQYVGSNNEAKALASSTAELIDLKGAFVMPELAKNGITSICEARTFWKRNQQDIWAKIETEGKLTVRVNLGLWAYPTEDDATQISKLLALHRNNPNSLLKINQIKLYADGIIHNTTAAMHDDYLVDYFKLGTNKGLNYFNEQPARTQPRRGRQSVHDKQRLCDAARKPGGIH